jgi:hypothetical protein
VELGAGAAAGFLDADFAEAGAQLHPAHELPWSSVEGVGITRDPVTGKYAVLADGAPLPIANFNDEHEPLADTIDEDDLAQLIGAQAHQIAASEEQNEQTRKSVFESRPPLVQFSGYRSQRLYIGPRLGQP